MTSGRKPVLPLELEQLLVRYCMEMEARYFSLTAADLKRMAFELAIQIGLSHNFNPKKEIYREDVVKIIYEERPGTFFPHIPSIYYIYEKELGKIYYNAPRDYNIHVSDLTVVQNKLQKVVATKHKNQDSNMMSGERRALITTVTCMDASANYVPPLFGKP
ncbi:hypothetical protein PR048_026964 [Dryococelus australis]|uniref:Uncharacterized protein n=1 Tax=Dryococelus australis TaxID=614101 RepID=A0ABQ9GMR5_9NEOP|nr:hypothetical protein PR048_026964 [Dryococelus australis]